MVATEFLSYLTEFKATSYVGVEDFADKFSFLFTVIIILICTLITSAKQFLLDSAIKCYIPQGHKNGFKGYLENFCWVHGTIPFRPDERLPTEPEEWEELDRTKRINYYQWVPFVLGLQCIMFYLPRVIWQLICYNRTGTDLEHIVNSANNAVHSEDLDKRNDLVGHIARNLEEMFFKHRDFRQGRFANARRKFQNACSFCVISKRLGNWLVFSYMFIKLLYLGNAIGQIYLMQIFLGFNGSMASFGVEVSKHIVHGRDWYDTLFFPRVTFCHVSGVRHVGSHNRYVAQCALPVNMLNEKIYVFLWFWTVLAAFLTAISVPTWLLRIMCRKNHATFIKKFLRIADQFSKEDQLVLQRFIRQFLRQDGVFLIRMINLNAGDLVTSEIVSKLWAIYKQKYKKRDLRNDVVHPDDYDPKTFEMEPGGNSFIRRPSAPQDKIPLDGEYV